MNRKQILDKATKLCEHRQAQYGNAVTDLDVHTIAGIVMMKAQRCYKGKDPKIEDEMLDIINYAVFTLLKLSTVSKK